jgi:hypothetical protein
MHWYVAALLWMLLIVGGIVLGRLERRWKRSVFVREYPDLKPPGDPVWFPDDVHISNRDSYPIITAEGTAAGAPKKLKVKEIGSNMVIWVDVNGESEKMRLRTINVSPVSPWTWQAQDEASLRRMYTVEDV